jgi:hypothetical protein
MIDRKKGLPGHTRNEISTTENGNPISKYG